jgi:hypothetical protein
MLGILNQFAEKSLQQEYRCWWKGYKREFGGEDMFIIDMFCVSSDDRRSSTWAKR